MEIPYQPFLISTILQSCFYILYLVSLAFALRWLLFKEDGWILKSRREVNWFLLTTTTLLFACLTGGIVNTALFQITLSRFEINSMVISKRLIVSGTLIETLTFIITDAVLIFRCWSVYQRSWCAICIPVVLWLANIGFLAFFIFYAATIFKHDTQFLFLQATVIFYLCNFATSLYTTGAIVYRVWRIANANSSSSSILYRVSRIVAGTGILYASTSLAIVVAAFLMSKNLVAYLVCNTINFSMAGITFNLLLIRVGQLRADTEMDVCASKPEANPSVLLSTVQFAVPSTGTVESSSDLETGYRGQTVEAPGIQEK